MYFLMFQGTLITITHKVHLTTDTPVHLPYPVPQNLRQCFDDEVARMLDLGVVEPSTSPYCSPVVLVKKADDT